MLESFKLKSVATYQDEYAEVSGLKKINFFYGANGCGKTTASNFLADPHLDLYKECSIRWQGNEALKTLVYNKAFRDKNFGGSDIAGVFTLGEATTEQVELIQAKKEELDRENDQLKGNEKVSAGKIQQLDTTINEFTEKCWKLYKKYGEDFKEVLRGALQKKLFKDRILQFSSNSSAAHENLEYDVLKVKAKTLLGERPAVYPELNIIEAGALQSVEQDDIWSSLIVGKSDVDIASLIDSLGANDWVSQGRKYVRDDICPFCQQPTISEHFKAQLEAYFDDEFSRQTEKVKRLTQYYERSSKDLVSSLYQLVENERRNPNSMLDLDSLSPYLQALENAARSNTTGFEEKVEKASLQLKVVSTWDIITEINKIILRANEEIREHNKLAIDFDNETERLKSEVWQFLANEISDEYKLYLKKVKGLEKAIASLGKSIVKRKEKVLELKNELAELSKVNTSVQPAVDEINRLLKAYGFINFEIVPSTQLANHYVIQRQDGTLALDTLSEGEVTFITFLYFIQLVNGSLTEDAVTDNRIVVIDDPISSLDSNVLFIVSAIVKQLIQDIKRGSNVKQLLLFTHNVYFHKEASYQGGRANGCNQTHFWILRKANNVTTIHPYEQRNPIESSYELLWREIKDQNKSSSITIQNTMRRILENYFKILGKFSDSDFETKFENLQEQQVCRSLLHWINDGSHCLPDDLYIQSQDDTVDVYRTVFKSIFEHSGHIAHYNMMMGIDKENTDDSEEQGVAA